MSMKNPLTPAGIEPVTFQFVAQHHNHCATAVRQVKLRASNKMFSKEAYQINCEILST